MLGSALRAGKEGRASLLLRQLDEVALVPRSTDGTTWLRKVALGTTGPSPEPSPTSCPESRGKTRCGFTSTPFLADQDPGIPGAPERPHL